ncbi:hypothetical protein ACTFIY_008526 [Dictyostelium cf. discoideum]
MNKLINLILLICFTLSSIFYNGVESLTLANLTSLINGKVISQSSVDFNNARAGYNARYNRIPQLIVQPRDTAGVVLALEYAQTNNYLVSIKSGGHSSIAEGVQDLRVVIDLSQMKQISYDNISNLIVSEPGNKWVELYNFTINKHQVAVPGGSCPSVAISGLVLGGGANDFSSVYGLAADNVVEMEVVLANRSVVIANNQTNPDLFWALRGAGHGGFGIVTKFTFKAHPVLPAYYSAWITFKWDDFEDAVAYLEQFSKTMPNQVNLYFAASKNANNTIPSVAMSCFYNGNPSDAEAHCGKFRSFPGRARNSVITPTSFTVTTTSYYETVRTGTDPKQRMSFTKGSILPELTQKVIKRIKSGISETPLSPYTFNNARVNLYWQGGAMNEKATDYNAYVHRTHNWSAVWLASFTGNQYIEPYQKWISKAYKKTSNIQDGVYQNYPDDQLEDWADQYYLTNYPRLLTIKAAYDPNNYFRHAQSIGAPSSN